MTFLQKLELLMEENKMKVPQLSKQSGVKNTTIYEFWKKGYENMKLSNFKAICDCFSVTMDSMAIDSMEIEYRVSKEGLSKEDNDVLTMLHAIKKNKRDSLIGYIKLEYDNHTALLEKPNRKVST